MGDREVRDNGRASKKRDFYSQVVVEETDRRLLKVFGAAQSLSLSLSLLLIKGENTHTKEKKKKTLLLLLLVKKRWASKIKQSQNTQSFCFFMFRDSQWMREKNLRQKSRQKKFIQKVLLSYNTTTEKKRRRRRCALRRRRRPKRRRRRSSVAP